jgi:hypothetical protein
MVKVTICFRDELASLLHRGRNKESHEIAFDGKRSVKDLIESTGIPHTEIGLILVNEKRAAPAAQEGPGSFKSYSRDEKDCFFCTLFRGISKKAVDFSYILQDGDRIEVRPALLRKYSAPGSGAGDEEILLLCDEHLWKLCRRLRLLGFDAAFNKEWDDARLAEISGKEGRVLLTRDRRLLMRKNVAAGLLIRSTDVEEQVNEVLENLDLKSKCRPFSRCLLCSGRLREAAAGDNDFEGIKRQIPLDVLSWCREYNICLNCGQVYWKGSHYKKLAEKVEKYTGSFFSSLAL